MPEIGTTKHGGLGKRGRNAEGMTLIETLGAVCILGICIGGVCALVVQAKQMTDRARDHYTAINIAKNRLELARAKGYAALGDFSEPPTIVNRKGVSDEEGDYQRETIISNPAPNLAEIVITVQIRNRMTRQFGTVNEVLRSYIADYLVPGE